MEESVLLKIQPFVVNISLTSLGLIMAMLRISNDCRALQVIQNIFLVMGAIASVTMVIFVSANNSQTFGIINFIICLFYLFLFNTTGVKDVNKNNKHSKRTYKF